MPPFVINELSVVREIYAIDLDLADHLTIEEMALVFFIVCAKVRHRRRMLTVAEIEREVARVRVLATKWKLSTPTATERRQMGSEEAGHAGSVH